MRREFPVILFEGNNSSLTRLARKANQGLNTENN